MASGVEGANAEAVEAKTPKTSADTNFILLGVYWIEYLNDIGGMIGVEK